MECPARRKNVASLARRAERSSSRARNRFNGRGDEPKSATTHFFILVGDGPHLDGKFSAFGRVAAGLEVADAINRAPAEAEKPLVPVRINHAAVAQCQK